MVKLFYLVLCVDVLIANLSKTGAICIDLMCLKISENRCESHYISLNKTQLETVTEKLKTHLSKSIFHKVFFFSFNKIHIHIGFLF